MSCSARRRTWAPAAPRRSAALLVAVVLALVPALHRLLRHEAGSGLLLAVVGGTQLALHGLLSVVGGGAPTAGGTTTAGHAGMAMPGHAHAPVPAPDEGAGLWMVGAHLVAVVAVVALLRCAERSSCSAARVARAVRQRLATVGAALRTCAALLAARPAPAVPVLGAPADRAGPLPLELLWAGGSSRRGPPLRVA
ncbi:MAG TPA: hypothetical protein VFR07_03460 [Mycobacteriales bacterium]|nr:hypothetical protein [Mycobacteriales bacterium]